MPQNPFLTHGYVEPLYFCDRAAETKQLVSALENERNVTLISIRRMGKTGLINHVFHKVKKKYDCVYVDILATTNLREFTLMFSKAVINQLETTITKSFSNVTSIFRKLKPVITLDPFSGMPSVEFDIKTDSESETTLQDIFSYLKSKKKKVIIAIDEFQQITTYPEKKTEALLRTYVQHLSNVVFIFSGSQKHTLSSMFHDSSRPFYQSTELLMMGQIDPGEYASFIEYHFKNNKRSISPEAVRLVLEWTRTHTFYVQILCNKLFSNEAKKNEEKQVLDTMEGILQENEGVFFNYMNLLTAQQWSLLKAIGKEGIVKRLNEKTFLNKYHLGASSVQRSIKALTDREMVLHDEGVYKVYDVFLSRWLERLP